MQEKIRDILCERLKIEFDPDPKQERFAYGGLVIDGWEEAAAEIATLFKRKVIWEGKGRIVHDLSDGATVSVPGIGRLTIDDRPSESRIGPHGQRVRVVVEKIDEQKRGDDLLL